MLKVLTPISKEQNNLSPITAEQNETLVNSIHHVPTKLDQEHIKKVAKRRPSILWSLDCQGILHKKIQTMEKNFMTLIVPISLKNMCCMKVILPLAMMAQLDLSILKEKILLDSFWKGSTEFLRHCLRCEIKNLQTPNYVQIHLEVPQMPMDLFQLI